MNLHGYLGRFISQPPNFKTVVKHCGVCGTQLVIRNNRDVKRRNYCSRRCNALAAARTEKLKFRNTKRVCKWCDETFVATKSAQQYCSLICCNKAAALGYKRRRAASQEGFFKQLIRTNSKRNGLTTELLIEIFERQQGRCAISGIEMTKVVGQGHVLTNVSIDRIDSAKEYLPGNVQLVCHIVNLMKHNMATAELVAWCNNIVHHQEQNHA